MAKLRVNHGPIDEAVADSLTKDEKKWLRSWNRHAEIPGEEAPAADDSEDSGESDYEDQGVEELKEDLKHRGLPVSGNKAELIARLEEDDEEDEDE